MVYGMSQNSFPFRVVTTIIAKLFMVTIIVIVVVALLNVMVLVISAALSAKFSNLVWHSLGVAFLIS